MKKSEIEAETIDKKEEAIEVIAEDAVEIEKETEKENRKNDLLIKVTEALSIFLIFFLSVSFMEIILVKVFGIPFYWRPIVYTFGYTLIISGLLSFVRKKSVQRILIIIVLLLITLLYLSETVFYVAFSRVALLNDLKNLNELAGVKGTISDFLSYNLFWYSLPLIVTGVAMYLRRKAPKPVNNVSWKIPLIMLVVGIFMVSGLNAFNSKVRIDENKLKFRNPTLYFKEYGLLETIGKEISSKVMPAEKTPNASIGRQIEENLVYLPEPNEMTNAFLGKNLIFIEGESIAPYAIDPILTPTLYKLKTEGTYFSNYYSSRPNTMNSEYAILTSAYFDDNRFYMEQEDTMPTLFSQINYSASSFHNNRGDFYQRAIRMPNLGFDVHYAAEELDTYPISDTDYASDVALFENAVEYIKPNESPFFSYFITISAHSSYKISDRPTLKDNFKVVQSVYPDYDPSLQSYLAGTMVTDQGVKVLFDYLEENDLLEDTVIAMAGDHYPYALDKVAPDVLNKQYGLGELEKHKVPFMIWDSSKPSKENDSLMTNIDILPTLSNMFNLDLQYAMGKDIYSSNKNDVMVDWFDFRSFSVLTPEGGYDAETGEIIGNLTQKEVDELQELSYERNELISDDYTRNRIRK